MVRRFGVADAAFVATSLTAVGSEIVLDEGFHDVVFNLANTGQALNDFALQVKAHKDGSFHTIISGATWGTVAGNLKEFVGALNTLASGAAGYAHVEVGPVYSVRFMASIASGTTAITILAQASTR